MGRDWTRRYRAVIAAAALAGAVACGGSGTRASRPPAQNSSSAGQQPAEKTITAGGMKVDLAKIFPPGPGRELVLANCQNCHTFAPIVLLQMDKDAWHRNSLDHRERVTTLSDEEFATLYSYLTANFGPDHPVPDLPKEFLKSWTSY